MATVKKIKKAQYGIKKTSDSTSYYKQRADAALKNLASDDLSNFGSNVKDFAKKQREYKSYTRRNKPGNDAKGKSNFEKLLGLKNGGKTIKKAQDGVTEKKSLKDKIFGTKEERQDRRLDRQSNREDRQLSREENREDRILRRQCVGGKCGGKARGFIGYKDGGKVMMKRADGSTSQRGLWDNIRSAAKKNKAAGKPGKKPTSAMLKQEKKIKSQTKKK